MRLERNELKSSSIDSPSASPRNKYTESHSQKIKGKIYLNTSEMEEISMI